MSPWCQPKNITNMSNPATSPLLYYPPLLLHTCAQYTHYAAVLMIIFTINVFFSTADFNLFSPRCPSRFKFSVLVHVHGFLMPTVSIVCCPGAGKSELFLHLRGKKGQAESGVDRAKPPPLWCVYRGRVSGMTDRDREGDMSQRHKRSNSLQTVMLYTGHSLP